MDIKFLKKTKHFKKGSEWHNIHLYWKIALGIIFLTVAMACVVGITNFLEIDKEVAVNTGTASDQDEKVLKRKLDSVLLFFATRQLDSNRIINTPAPVVDPSL